MLLFKKRTYLTDGNIQGNIPSSLLLSGLNDLMDGMKIILWIRSQDRTYRVARIFAPLATLQSRHYHKIGLSFASLPTGCIL